MVGSDLRGWLGIMTNSVQVRAESGSQFQQWPDAARSESVVLLTNEILPEYTNVSESGATQEPCEFASSGLVNVAVPLGVAIQTKALHRGKIRSTEEYGDAFSQIDRVRCRDYHPSATHKYASELLEQSDGTPVQVFDNRQAGDNLNAGIIDGQFVFLQVRTNALYTESFESNTDLESIDAMSLVARIVESIEHSGFHAESRKCGGERGEPRTDINDSARNRDGKIHIMGDAFAIPSVILPCGLGKRAENVAQRQSACFLGSHQHAEII